MSFFFFQPCWHSSLSIVYVTYFLSYFFHLFLPLCYELQNEKGKSWQGPQSSGSFMSLDVMSSLVACVPVNEVVMSGVLLMNIMSFITFVLDLIVRVSARLALFLCLWLIEMINLTCFCMLFLSSKVSNI